MPQSNHYDKSSNDLFTSYQTIHLEQLIAMDLAADKLSNVYREKKQIIPFIWLHFSIEYLKMSEQYLK